MNKGPVRCAVYTRKSSEEGLEQSFNSIDAQQEACRAFIQSQKQEGWIALAERYDDGGFSGGSMVRPALQQLLQHIQAGRIHVVVVYKVDRLTRSLADFAKIIEIFDSHQVSFVSVTQQFNTTSSMCRLTLNVLLSFAQFEREVTGERIRDKIAASKRRGMWMGGNAPLGYDSVDHRLVINPAEAETVRAIYRQYLKFGGVRQLQQFLAREKIYSKVRRDSQGRTTGGCSFSRGALSYLLQNRVYIGEIKHKDQFHPGQHEAIIDPALWQKVAKRFEGNNRSRGMRPSKASLLTRILFTVQGARFAPTYTLKEGQRYRYYTAPANPSSSTGKSALLRVPAAPLEELIVARIQRLLEEPQEFLKETIPSDLNQAKLAAAAHSFATRHAAEPPAFYGLTRSITKKVSVGEAAAWIVIDTKAFVAKLLDENKPGAYGFENLNFRDFTVKVDFRMRRRGGSLQLLSPELQARPHEPAPAFLQAMARARVWYERIVAGEISSIEALAKEVQMTPRSTRRILRWALLSPDLVEPIVRGTFTPPVSALEFARRVPINWREQQQQLLA